MTAGLTESGSRVCFQSAMQTLIDGLKPGRALIFFDGEVRSRHGLPELDLESLPVSLSVIHSVLEEAQPLHCSKVAADPELSERWSVVVSQVESLICVPLWSPQGAVVGVIYADCGPEQKTLLRPHFNQALDTARRLERVLYHGASREQLALPLTGKPRPASRPQPKARRRAPDLDSALELPRPRRKAAEVSYRFTAKGRLLFLQSLSTMVEAGIPLHQALEHLSPADEIGSACGQMAEFIASGRTFSRALAADPELPELYQRMVEVGERSGNLSRILSELAAHEERSQQRQLRLRSILTYPAVVSLFAALVMMILPPFVLEGQFEMIRNSGVTPPALTLWVMAFSSVVRSPIFLICLAALLLLACIQIPRSLKEPRRRRWWFRWGLRLPGVSRLLFLLGATRFAESLRLQLEAGLPLLEALEAAGAATGNPYFARSMRRATKELEEGSSVSDSLAQSGWFDPTFLSLVEVGEETGRLPALLGWNAKILEEEFDYAVECYTAMVEPLVLLFLGFSVGILVIATLMPTIAVLQSL